MWRMNTGGDRVFTDTEWAVFAAGLDLLRDWIESDIKYQSDDSATGIKAFDCLTPEQKLALLADVSTALRDPAVPTPPHTAANEGAIMAVIATFENMLKVELEGDEGQTQLRTLLLAAFDRGRPDRLPKPTTKKWERWDDLIERFEHLVFWDSDYALGDHFLDLPPNEAGEKLEAMTIDPDYFLATPREPDEKQLRQARQTLAKLLGLAFAEDEDVTA